MFVAQQLDKGGVLEALEVSFSLFAGPAGLGCNVLTGGCAVVVV
jgi:hypothetical protein